MDQAKRYQAGALEKKTTAKGVCWYIRFAERDGSRPRIRIGFVADLPTKTLARKAASDLVKSFNERSVIEQPVHTMGEVIHRYQREELPKRVSTSRGYQNYLKRYIEPRWGHLPITEVKPNDVRLWLPTLDLASKTRSHILNLMRSLFNYAMLWEWIPAAVNPLSLFRLKDATKRASKPRVLTPAEFLKLVEAVGVEPYRTMMLLCSCLGLTCSELFGLRWEDFDWKMSTVKIQRGIVDGNVDEVKNEHREKSLPMHQLMCTIMREHWRLSEAKELTDWVFASPHSAFEKPYHPYRVQQYKIAPAAKRIGLGEGIGWHTLRHSYRSWLDRTGAPIGVQRDLMRHADIRTTMNVYGDSFMDDLRKANDGVVGVILQ